MKLFVRRSGIFFLTLIITNLVLIGTAIGQRFAVTSGNWNDPIWATTAAGVAGSAATPTAANPVTINAGVTVTMNVTGNCSTLTLQTAAVNGSVITGAGGLTIAGNISVNSVATGTSGAEISSPLNLGTANRTITVADDGTSAIDLTISGVISGGTNIGFTKTGAGTMFLSGSNTYTGTTTITGGIIRLGATGDATNTPLGTTTARTIVGAGTSLDLNGFTLGTAELLTLNGTGISGGGALTNTSATAVDYSGLITLNAASSIITNAGDINITNTGTITGGTRDLTLGGSGNGTVASLIGTTTGSLFKTGTGTWTLTGANTYRGVTNIASGTLKIGGGSNIYNGSAVTVDGILDLAGASETIGSLAGTGTVTSSLTGNIVLTSGSNGTSTSFSGIIENGAATSVGLIKGGAGIWTLSGNNTYTGTTVISTGRIQLGSAGDGTNSPLGTANGGTTVNNGTSLDLNGFTLSTNESLSIFGSGILAGGAISNSSATAVSYNAPITMAGSASIIANAGDINIINNSSITGNGFTLTIGGSGNGTLERSLDVGLGRLTKTGTGTWTVSGNSSFAGTTTISAGIFVLGAAGDGVNSPVGTITGRTSITSGATLELNGITLSTAELLTLNGAGVAGTGGLLNSSATPVDYTGAISLGSAGAIGTVGDISFTTNAIGGLQDLTKLGNGSLNLGSGNSAIKGLIISEGAVSSSVNLLSLTGDFVNNANFNNNNGTVRFNGTTVPQNIGGSVATTFNRVSLTNPMGLSLNTDAIINGLLTLTSGSFSIGANTLTLNSTVTGTGTFTGSASSNLTIGGSGAFGALNFDQTTDLVSNAVANLIINRTAGGSVTLGSTFNVLTSATLTNGVLNVNGRILRLGGTVARTAGTITNANAAGNITFNGSLSQNIPASIFTTNTSTNITISNPAGVTFNSSLAISGNLQIDANSLFIPAAAVIISGAGTLLGVDAATSIAQVTRSTGTSDLTGQYTLNRNLINLVIEYAGSAAQGIAATTTFGGLKISNTANVVMAGNVTTGNLILNSGNLQIGGTTFTINGAVSRTAGNLRGSNAANLVIGGAAGALFFEGAGTGNYLRNLLMNTGASASLGNALNITAGTGAGTEGALRINGTAVLTTGGFLTIKSSASGTGRIATGNTAGGYIIGDVTVERFIPQNASKAWRLLASNTSGQTINAAWQEGQIGPLSNTNPGFGTMIPGVFTTVAQAQAAGFDTLSQGASIYRYDAVSDNLVGVANTNATLLSSQPGYFIYIRGDRSPYQFGAGTVATTSTTLRSKGTVFQGDQSTSSVPDGQYALLRNPYASAIDLRNVVVGGSLVDAFEVWDPQLYGSFGLGGYQTLTRSGADYVVTPGGGSYPPSLSIVNTIESGAAFFVQATGGTGTLQILESSKTAGSNLRFRPSGVLTEDSRLVTNLYVAGTNALADGNLIFVDAANNNGLDNKDVKKFTNFGENFGIDNNGVKLVVERRSLTSGDTIFFSMGRLKAIAYKLEFKPSGINSPLLEAFLEDTHKATATPVSLTDATTYNFTVDGNPASTAAGRFRIVFRPQGTLPVTFTNIKAAQVNNNISVEWKVANQLNIISYEVEKSTNGRSFEKMATQPATQMTGQSITYTWLDEHVVTGVNYYRIKAVELSGSPKYTEIVTVVIGKNGKGITVSPNPVRGSLVNIQLNNQQPGRYNIRLVNNAGQEIYKNVYQHAGGSASQSIMLPATVTRGIYQLQVIAPDATKNIQKLIIDRND